MNTMHGFSKLIGGLIGLAMMGMAGAANASIIYSVNRTIGAGTVVGFIETDGTLGILSLGNITNWNLTLTAPNLLGGSPDVIDFATQGLNSILVGNAVSATPSQLSFDFSLPGANAFVLEGGSTNFWCLVDVFFGCTNLFFTAEVMGFDLTGFSFSQEAQRTGVLVFAVASVPEPASLALFAIALGGLGFMTRRHRRYAQEGMS